MSGDSNTAIIGLSINGFGEYYDSIEDAINDLNNYYLQDEDEE
jgi:hypothetical protein